ncbi:TonB-dependent receptor [Tunicatimonas pelagia]|uniref:TonB-dependent receptor n=1 Tax=Tunicatimonas pelagia TaxID=931531 RepID=UPI002665096B|nr:TonB-dependent receptor [Tunicatimonas pelagia]WKN44087.1 TonB-dependent receptor [Tunicatimonas pelagia]
MKESMRPHKLLHCTLLILFCSLTGWGQDQYTISGYITEAASGEPLIGANIYEIDTQRGGSTNVYGFYSLTLPTGSYQVRFSSLGYEADTLTLLLTQDTIINQKLAEAIMQLQTVQVVSTPQLLEHPQMSAFTLRPQEMEQLPTLAGEVDLIKVAQLLPGIQSGNEGSSDLIVRGGGPDQNLILLDGVPVYNVGHLLGLVSVFNTDAVKRVDVVKGGFPARYGGRLSSVVDIQLKEGNTQERHGSGAIGLLSAKYLMEGPLGSSGKTSYLFSVRRTWLDLLAQLGQVISDTEDRGQYNFFDINAKINHRFSDNDRVYLSAYTGRDSFSTRLRGDQPGVSFQESSAINWGNITSALRWNHVFTPKLFANLTATYSQYAFAVDATSQEENEAQSVEGSIAYTSRVRDLGLQWGVDYAPDPRHAIKAGFNTTFHRFRPGAINYSQVNQDTVQLDSTFNDQPIQALEGFVYLEDEIQATDRLRANVGVHASGFLVDRTSYHSVQPRLSIGYQLTSRSTFKASYTRMAQFLHLLTNANLGVPTDIWVPTTARIRPQRAWQAAVGTAHQIGRLTLEIEGYYKEMQNVIDYQEANSIWDDPDGFLLESGSNWEDKVIAGEGRSYGAELLLRRAQGRLTGWFGYTLAWAERRFDEIDEGAWFPSPYDRRHDLSLVASYQLFPRISIGSNFVYATGRPVTLPIANYLPPDLYDGAPPNRRFVATSIDYFGSRNSYRMPAYHRLDVSINFTKQKKWGERTWSLSVYNTYNRQNAYYWFVQGGTIQRNDRLSPDRRLYQVSLFTIIPTISYRFTF